ncbi:MAG: hypothetical protein M9907_00700 [Burkholderiaceae bacterium]|nr:hypothetical protein [Burkholderiaceae bacterium]
MKSFRITICDATRCERIDGVTSFVGEDASGQFGVMAGRRPFATVLVYGLARLRCGDAPWRYVALPEATLHFADDILSLATRRYLVGDDYGRIRDALERDLRREEQQIAHLKGNLARLEEAMLRRLMTVERA